MPYGIRPLAETLRSEEMAVVVSINYRCKIGTQRTQELLHNSYETFFAFEEFMPIPSILWRITTCRHCNKFQQG